MSEMILARRYARSIFDLAKEEGLVERIGGEISALEKATSNEPKWLGMLDSINVPLENKFKMIDEIAQKGGFERYVTALLKILAEKNRVHLLHDIKGSYEEERLKEEGFIEAVAIVADKGVWGKLKEEIHSAADKISGKRTKVTCKEDPEMIGGIIIKIGDTVYDGSIRGELDRLRKSLIKKQDEIR